MQQHSKAVLALVGFRQDQHTQSRQLAEIAQLRGNGPGQRVGVQVPACSTGHVSLHAMGTEKGKTRTAKTIC